MENKTRIVLHELKMQLTALHYMGQSTQSHGMYVTYSEQVTKYIFKHKFDILAYIDSWVDNQWSSTESIWSTFIENYNEGEELEALRVLSIK